MGKWQEHSCEDMKGYNFRRYDGGYSCEGKGWDIFVEIYWRGYYFREMVGDIVVGK